MKKEIKEILTKGVEKIVDERSLRKKLFSGRRLRIKFGIDPTATQIHLGQAVTLWKLRGFQKLGHKIIFIIGDFTARIGDPSGKTETRKPLSEKEIKNNFKTYKQQINRILDIKKTEIVYNSSYFSSMPVCKFYPLLSCLSVAQLLERGMFRERIKNKKPIYISEFLYPLLQAYDSVKVKADLEIGGSDQLFNMLLGRNLQSVFGQPPQDVMTLKLLMGIDGKKKMSQSLHNFIGINESPYEQFGKTMSIPDGLIWHYFELATDVKIKEIENLKKRKTKPILLKEKLAFESVKRYWGEEKAKLAKENFEQIFKKRQMPQKGVKEMKIAPFYINLKRLLTETNLVSSRSQAQRLIKQGAIEIDGEAIRDWQKEIRITKPTMLRVGKHSFYRLIPR